jgi:hypothetical protein
MIEGSLWFGLDRRCSETLLTPFLMWIIYTQHQESKLTTTLMFFSPRTTIRLNCPDASDTP